MGRQYLGDTTNFSFGSAPLFRRPERRMAAAGIYRSDPDWPCLTTYMIEFSGDVEDTVTKRYCADVCDETVNPRKTYIQRFGSTRPRIERSEPEATEPSGVQDTSPDSETDAVRRLPSPKHVAGLSVESQYAPALHAGVENSSVED